MEAAADCEQDASALVWGFFGMLRRSELRVGLVTPAGGVFGSCLRVGLVTPAGGAVVVTIRTQEENGPVGPRGAGLLCGDHAQWGSDWPNRAPRPRKAYGHGRLVAGTPVAGSGEIRDPRGIGTVKERLRAGLREVMLLLLELAGLSSHSLRKGGASAAANAGVSEEEIKAHGRWKSDAVKVLGGQWRCACP